MSIKDWPRAERPGEKLLALGPKALTDAELLSVMIRTGVRGRDAVQLARDALAETGGLRSLIELERHEFTALCGLGPVRYVELQAAIELTRRYLLAPLERDGALDEPARAREYLLAQLKSRHAEIFGCMFLDARHRLIRFDEIFFGTIDAATVYPREIVRRALQLNAAAVILAHNHPSGIAEPSQADVVLTQRLKDALSLIDTRVLDHFVIGDCEAVSFAERGLL